MTGKLWACVVTNWMARKRERAEDSDEDDFVVPDDEEEELSSGESASEDEEQEDISEDDEEVEENDERSSESQSEAEEDEEEIVYEDSQDENKEEIEEPLESRRSKRAKKTYTNTEHDLKNMYMLRKCHNSYMRDVIQGGLQQKATKQSLPLTSTSLSETSFDFNDITIRTQSNTLEPHPNLFSLLKQQTRKRNLFTDANDYASVAELYQNQIIHALGGNVPRVPIIWNPKQRTPVEVIIPSKNNLIPDLSQCEIHMRLGEHHQTKMSIWKSISHAMAHIAVYFFEGHYSDGEQNLDIGGYYCGNKFHHGKYFTEYLPNVEPLVQIALSEYKRLFNTAITMFPYPDKKQIEYICSPKYREDILEWNEQAAWLSHQCQVNFAIPKFYANLVRSGVRIHHCKLFDKWAERIDDLFPYMPRVHGVDHCPQLEDVGVLLYCTVCHDVMKSRVQYSDFIDGLHNDDKRGIHKKLGVDGRWKILSTFKEFAKEYGITRQNRTFTQDEIHFIVYEKLCSDKEAPVPRIIHQKNRTYDIA